MKRKALVFIFLVISSVLQAQSKILAHISNVRNDRGVCQVCLFNNAASFDGENGTPVQCVQAPVKNGNSEAQFENIAAGVYAVLVFHDANTNKKLDQNFIGIPKEGYGASRNKLPFAAAPSFDENKFTVPDKTTTTLRIKLRNL
jgi:uncharacterized protein (DUF2141 family)